MAVAHPSRPFDLEDLLAAPEDGYRYEVLDGAPVVNAAPSWRHQQIVARLLRLLEDAAPEPLVVLPSPVWLIAPGQIPEPDLLVASTELPPIPATCEFWAEELARRGQHRHNPAGGRLSRHRRVR